MRDWDAIQEEEAYLNSLIEAEERYPTIDDENRAQDRYERHLFGKD